MNLTIASLEKISADSESILASEYIKAQMEVQQELIGLKKMVDGSLQVCQDLQICYESLQESGFTQEWFDIVNQGNRFVALCNLEMPKFFGGDEVKKQACEGAIIDTLKGWIKKAGQFILMFIKKVLEWIDVIMKFWGVQTRGQNVFMETVKRLENMLDSVGVATGDGFKAKDASVISRYLDNLNTFFNCLNNTKCLENAGMFSVKQRTVLGVPAGTRVDLKSPEYFTGDPDKDTINDVISSAIRYNANGELKFVGYDIDPSTGMRFVEMSDIPTINYFLSKDHVTLGESLAKCEVVGRALITNFSRLRDLLINMQRAIQRVSGTVDHDSYGNSINSAQQMQRCRCLLEKFIKPSMDQVSRLSNEATNVGNACRAKMNEYMAKHSK